MRGVELIAHRGCADAYPENTVRAARQSAERLPAVEVDVRRCATGELVAFHDERVDRITDGEGRIADLPLSELRDLRVEGSDEPIPRLDRVLDAVPPNATLQLELKEIGIAEDVAALARDVENDVRLSSFLPEAFREVPPEASIPTGYLFRDDPGANLETATALGCANVHPHWKTCVETDVVDRARERGFGAFAWGAGADLEAIAAARAAGVDGVTVDRPGID